MFIGIIALVVLVVVGVPVGLSFFILMLIKKGNHDKRLRLIALLPILAIGYFIYTAFFPTDSFYKEDFEEVTGIKFPENGEIVDKTASYPDQFGDYGSTAIVKVDREFYDNLEEQLKAKGFSDNQYEEETGPFELEKVSESIGGKKIEKEFSKTADGGKFYYVGFLSDKETLIVQRQSW